MKFTVIDMQSHIIVPPLLCMFLTLRPITIQCTLLFYPPLYMVVWGSDHCVFFPSLTAASWGVTAGYAGKTASILPGTHSRGIPGRINCCSSWDRDTSTATGTLLQQSWKYECVCVCVCVCVRVCVCACVWMGYKGWGKLDHEGQFLGYWTRHLTI